MRKTKVSDIIFYSVFGISMALFLLAVIILEVRVQKRWDAFTEKQMYEIQHMYD